MAKVLVSSLCLLISVVNGVENGAGGGEQRPKYQLPYFFEAR